MVTDDAVFSQGKRGMILRPAIHPFEVYGPGFADGSVIGEANQLLPGKRPRNTLAQQPCEK